MLECSMLRYITCTLLPVDFLSLASSLPPSHPFRFPSAQTRKSNSKLTKRTFILSPLANCHLFADWNFLLLVGLRDKRLNEKKKLYLLQLQFVLFPELLNERTRFVTVRNYYPRVLLQFRKQSRFSSQRSPGCDLYEQFYIRNVGEVKGYALFQRYFKTMACWGQVIIPLSATATPHVDLHNHHGLPYRALRS